MTVPLPAPPPSVDPLVPAALTGVWHRSLLVDADGRHDTTTSVVWVQGPVRYVDLRRPEAVRTTVPGPPLDALPFARLLDLARQEAFAGRLRRRGDTAHWLRDLDYAPLPGPDAGRLRTEGSLLVETGLHKPYTEHWRPHPEGAGPCAAAELRDVATGCRAVLVRAGSWFAYARDRAEPLPGAAPLPELVRGARDIASARALLDLEVSVGRVRSGRWLIRRSTLPHRVGTDLAPAPYGDSRLVITRRRRFEITAAEGPPQALTNHPEGASR